MTTVQFRERQDWIQMTSCDLTFDSRSTDVTLYQKIWRQKMLVSIAHIRCFYSSFLFFFAYQITIEITYLREINTPNAKSRFNIALPFTFKF